MAIEVDPIEKLKQFVKRYPSQRVAAEALGITQAHLSGMLTGRTPVSPRALEHLGLRRAVIVEK